MALFIWPIQERSQDLGTLIRLSIDVESGLAEIVLNNPLRFNTMTWALGDDMRLAVDHVRKWQSSIQAVGRTVLRPLQGALADICRCGGSGRGTRHVGGASDGAADVDALGVL